MQFKDLPIGTTFTINAYKSWEGEAIINNREEYIDGHVEVTPVYESLKPFSKIETNIGSKRGYYLRNGFVFWNTSQLPTKLSKSATTEFYKEVL